jgi:hypothetical protein
MVVCFLFASDLGRHSVRYCNLARGNAQLGVSLECQSTFQGGKIPFALSSCQGSDQSMSSVFLFKCGVSFDNFQLLLDQLCALDTSDSLRYFFVNSELPGFSCGYETRRGSFQISL